jgi:hypothetical protein
VGGLSRLSVTVLAVIFLPRCEELRDVGDLTLGGVPLYVHRVISTVTGPAFGRALVDVPCALRVENPAKSSYDVAT